MSTRSQWIFVISALSLLTAAVTVAAVLIFMPGVDRDTAAFLKACTAYLDEASATCKAIEEGWSMARVRTQAQKTAAAYLHVGAPADQRADALYESALRVSVELRATIAKRQELEDLFENKFTEGATTRGVRAQIASRVAVCRTAIRDARAQLAALK